LMGYSPDHFNHAIARKLNLRKYRSDTQGIFFLKSDVDALMAKGAAVGRKLANPVKTTTTPKNRSGLNGTVPTSASEGAVTVVGTVDLIQTLLKAGIGVNLTIPTK
jgi:hypothetical protein